jgi:hypothetical protein
MALFLLSACRGVEKKGLTEPVLLEMQRCGKKGIDRAGVVREAMFRQVTHLF